FQSSADGGADLNDRVGEFPGTLQPRLRGRVGRLCGRCGLPSPRRGGGYDRWRFSNARRTLPVEDEAMTVFIPTLRQPLARLGAMLLLLCPLAVCDSPDPKRVQGYVEGEYVYVASPLAGTLETLSVRRGERVSVGVPLFALDAAPEKAARD